MIDPRIEAAEKLSKLPGIGQSPWVLYRLQNSTKILTEKRCYSEQIAYEFVSGHHVKGGLCNLFEPWLRIEDSNPWSSAAILSRAKYAAVLLGNRWYLVHVDSWCNPDTEPSDIYGYRLEDALLLDQDLSGAEQETANILGIINLYGLDREAYNLAMKPLLGEKP